MDNILSVLSTLLCIVPVVSGVLRPTSRAAKSMSLEADLVLPVLLFLFLVSTLVA